MQDSRCLDFRQVRKTGARFLRQQPLISVTSQGLDVGTPCALAAVGIRRDMCWLVIWPPPAAPDVAALSDAGLGTSWSV